MAKNQGMFGQGPNQGQPQQMQQWAGHLDAPRGLSACRLPLEIAGSRACRLEVEVDRYGQSTN